MKADVLTWSRGAKPEKLPSKETLNHAELIRRVTGIDVYADTQTAYRRAYAALGIDLINRVPLENRPPPTPPGEQSKHPTKPYTLSSLGVYDTAVRHAYAANTIDDVWQLDLGTIDYDDLIVPVPHPCRAADIQQRQAALGSVGMYYPMLYTTLFMWAVEVLGWELFMVTAMLEPERFRRHFLAPCAAKSRAIVTEIAQASECPFVFLHDDLADANGPIFPPRWYDEHIFPFYPEIFAPAREAGKRIIFVADGNMARFLPKLLELGVDGIMFENPATPLEAVIEHFGQPGRFFIGGIDTGCLTFGTPEQVRRMVWETVETCGDYPGFALSSCGGLHGNIPWENLEAYFDARVEVNATPGDWRRSRRRVAREA